MIMKENKSHINSGYNSKIDTSMYAKNNVNNTFNYYNKTSKILPRSKTNSRKRGTIMLKGKDSRNVPTHITPSSIRPNRGSVKRTPMAYVGGQGRTKSTNNRSNLKDRIKTIDNNVGSNFRSIMTRSNTVQKRRKIQINNNFRTNDSSILPYSNFAPSTNTRSNITIDRSESVGYGKLGVQQANPTSMSHITSKKSNSRKMISDVNEYEDDNVTHHVTITTVGNNSSTKELIKKPKFTRVTKKEGLRSKSNKRTIKDNFERVYMQSPCKIGRKINCPAKLKKNI
jgi:hypothetical protein